jgi:hypothetical protein
MKEAAISLGPCGPPKNNLNCGWYELMARFQHEGRMSAGDKAGTWQAEILRVIVPAIIGALSAVSVAFFTQANESRELDLKMVDTALAILAGEKGGNEAADDQGYVLSRTFALRALKQYSKVEITDDEMSEWALSGALQSGTFLSVGTVLVSEEPGFVQLASVRSIEDANAKLASLTERFGDLFRGNALEIRSVDLGARGTYQRVVLPVKSRAESGEICTAIKEQGGDCIVF